MIEMLNRKREVIKPWGKEVIWAETKDYVGKLLYINEGHKLSLQYHEEKEETILVISGELELTISGHARIRHVHIEIERRRHFPRNTWDNPQILSNSRNKRGACRSIN